MPRIPLRALVFPLLLWMAFLLSPLGAKGTPAQRDDQAPWAELEANFHQDVNAVRASRHLLPLGRRAELDRVARAHSEDMARRRYLSHESPEGRNPVDRLEGAGVSGFTLAAENAGMTSRRDPNREILLGWLTSRVHRQNLHAPPFNATGVGVAQAADGTFFYTQLYVTYPRDPTQR
jgi:uncharacterized protein YkwD